MRKVIMRKVTMMKVIVKRVIMMNMMNMVTRNDAIAKSANVLMMNGVVNTRKRDIPLVNVSVTPFAKLNARNPSTNVSIGDTRRNMKVVGNPITKPVNPDAINANVNAKNANATSVSVSASDATKAVRNAVAIEVKNLLKQ
jgi:hypothetical protein